MKKNKFPFSFLTYPLPSPIHISDKAEGKEQENFLVIYYEYWFLCQTNWSEILYALSYRSTAKLELLSCKQYNERR